MAKTYIILFISITYLLPSFVRAQVSFFNTVEKHDHTPTVYMITEDKTDDDIDEDEESDYADTTEIVNDTVIDMPYFPQVAMPLKKIKVTSLFGVRRDPFNKKPKRHNGVDLKAKYEPVYAMLPGEVIAVGSSKTAGNYVTMRHGICICSYLHLSQVLVKAGSHVSAGQAVAVSGNTGRSTGAHLHISCRFSDDSKKRYFDPLILLRFIARKQTNKT